MSKELIFNFLYYAPIPLGVRKIYRLLNGLMVVRESQEQVPYAHKQLLEQNHRLSLSIYYS